MSKQVNEMRQKQSLVSRLLWPVNLITFGLLICFFSLLVAKVETSLQLAMASKIESISTFLQTIGQTYVTNYDIAAVENFSKIATRDPDIAYVVYYDEVGKPMTDLAKLIKASNIIQVERTIKDTAGKNVGRVEIGYKTDRLNSVFWQILLMGAFSVLLIQILSSLAVYAISKKAVDPIKHTLLRLSKTSNVLSDTSREISKFSSSLSLGVNHQSEAVHETTTAMAQMSSMLNQTSGFAKQSEAIMLEVTVKANSGMSIMNQMVSSMASVQQANDQLQQIAEIIREISSKTNIINSIVFKTQLLSFNASIEAARAGQHGRGFAVVAEEIGKLANMSGKAAKEIDLLLQGSEKQVDNIVQNTLERAVIGRRVTDEAFRNFQAIANDINLISEQVSKITTAAREQEIGVVQTNRAMNELNKTAELNHQIAERSNQTSYTLEREVQVLDNISRDIKESITGHVEMSAVPKNDEIPALEKNETPLKRVG